MSSATTGLVATLLPALAALAIPVPIRLRRWQSFSGGALAAAALLIVLPEVWQHSGYLLLGFLSFLLTDLLVHPVWSALPLWLAMATHSLLDGALLALAPPHSLPSWILLLHRIPEALAEVALLRTTQPSIRRPGIPIALLQLVVLAGYVSGEHLNHALLAQSYAFSGGALLFLALHRLHVSWRESNFCWRTSATDALSVALLRVALG